MKRINERMKKDDEENRAFSGQNACGTWLNRKDEGALKCGAKFSITGANYWSLTQTTIRNSQESRKKIPGEIVQEAAKGVTLGVLEQIVFWLLLVPFCVVCFYFFDRLNIKETWMQIAFIVAVLTFVGYFLSDRTFRIGPRK